jgi:hypothetical protein
VTTVSKHENRLNVGGEKHPAGVARDESDRLRYAQTGADLVRAMADRRVRDLDFEYLKARLAIRSVKL